MLLFGSVLFFFFFQAEDGIRDKLDWSSDVCSSDLRGRSGLGQRSAALVQECRHRAALGSTLRLFVRLAVARRRGKGVRGTRQDGRLRAPRALVLSAATRERQECLKARACSSPGTETI